MRNSNYLAISKIFSPVFMDNLANNNIQAVFETLNILSQNYPKISKDTEIKKILQNVYQDFSRNYRNEHFYKNTLFNEVILKNHNLNNCLPATEFSVGNSIVDLAVFNGTSTAYEIKSEKDNPKRLLQQIEDYQKAFEFVYIVTYPKFIEKIQKDVPQNVGIILLENNVLIEKRKAISNMENFEHEVFFNILRLAEFKNIVKKRFGYIPDVPNTKIYKECFKLFIQIPILDVHYLFIEEIRKREISSFQKNLVKNLPKSVKVSIISKRYSEAQCENLIDKLKLIY